MELVAYITWSFNGVKCEKCFESYCRQIFMQVQLSFFFEAVQALGWSAGFDSSGYSELPHRVFVHVCDFTAVWLVFHGIKLHCKAETHPPVEGEMEFI